jgi:hypothetical protein
MSYRFENEKEDLDVVFVSSQWLDTKDKQTTEHERLSWGG